MQCFPLFLLLLPRKKIFRKKNIHSATVFLADSMNADAYLLPVLPPKKIARYEVTSKTAE